LPEEAAEAYASKMAILVTGGAGFIGSHTAELSKRSGVEVVIIDNLTTGR
jgi:UDP-glucose 4-epimerase